ncbi:Phosphate transport system permease protein PstA [Polystyrenella longa]|uniref:Phosphate transport system permease protein PstA n=1 Tax=Polystyrenella longa TaxID=2528007 RepID=A0A518CHL4_9PLAN|nr:phosphate ABC transporter permease PstA [Polystyrenella longa]QDU78717.1 Phosphate transport system permease protein PstA [Polystyrenella longa]
MSNPNQMFDSQLAARHRLGKVFATICFLSTWFSFAALIVMLGTILWQGGSWLTWDFLTSYDSRMPAVAGIKAGLWGSFWLILLTTLFSIPVGVGAAVYLEEYASKSRLTRIIQINLANLAGVPSIVYGILGLSVFVQMFDFFRVNPKTLVFPLGIAELRVPLPFGPSVLSGALTLSLLILPVVIVASQEALRSVPSSIRHASVALGATRWQTIRDQVLPAALPGILTGMILSISRAIGETAPILMMGALVFVAATPGNIDSPAQLVTDPQGVMDAPFDSFTTLPILIFNWVSRPKEEYQYVSAAGILVLLIVLLALNGVAISIRNRYSKRARW